MVFYWFSGSEPVVKWIHSLLMGEPQAKYLSGWFETDFVHLFESHLAGIGPSLAGILVLICEKNACIYRLIWTDYWRMIHRVLNDGR